MVMEVNVSLNESVGTFFPSVHFPSKENKTPDISYVALSQDEWNTEFRV